MRRRAKGAGLLLLLALGVIGWIARGGGRTAGAETSGGERADDGTPRAAELVDAAAPERELPARAASAPVAPGRAEAPPAASPRTRAPIRGRLVIAGSGLPLDEVLRVHLHTGNPQFAETLTSAPDGTFASTLEFPRGVVLARVLRPAGDEAVDCEGSFDPAEESEWIVPVPWPTFLHGSVVDRAGRGVSGVEVLVSSRSAPVTAGVATKEDGEFRIERLSPGPWTLYLSRGFAHAEIPLAIARGPNELGELRSPFGEAAGDIGGRLRATDGEPAGTLVLVDPAHDLVVTTETDADDETDGVSSFLFRGVPPGEYRLELISRDGRRYEPGAQRVSPPASELEFEAVGAQDALQLMATDGEEELGGYGLLRVHGQWLVDSEDFPCAEVERWILLASRHRPATGERPQTSQIRPRLEPGYGQAFLFSEVGGELWFPYSGGRRGRPLAGVVVLADGRAQATSDADGLALLSLADPPGTIEFQLNGWHLQARRSNGQITLVAMERD